MHMYRSRRGSNHPEPLSIEFPRPIDKLECVEKVKGKMKKQQIPKKASKI
jgi:hypothetical protein